MDLTALKAWARRVRYLPDRLLHGRRRRRLLERLGELDVRTAVFICHGNINRSAYAAGRFGGRIPAGVRDRVVVSSAGFIGPDRPASEQAREQAWRRGVDLSGHRSRLVDAESLRRTDLIVVMDTKQRREICRLTGKPASAVVVVGDLDPEPVERRAVQDPYGCTMEVFERVFDRIDRCIDELSGALWRGDRASGEPIAR